MARSLNLNVGQVRAISLSKGGQGDNAAAGQGTAGQGATGQGGSAAAGHGDNVAAGHGDNVAAGQGATGQGGSAAAGHGEAMYCRCDTCKLVFPERGVPITWFTISNMD